jgi:hypothetical protein
MGPLRTSTDPVGLRLLDATRAPAAGERRNFVGNRSFSDKDRRIFRLAYGTIRVFKVK